MAIADPAPNQGDVAPGAVDQGAPAQGGGAAMNLVQGINDDIIDLMELMQEAGAPEDALRDLAGVLQGYQQAVTKALQGGQQQAPQQAGQPEQGGNVPVEAGAASVRPAL
jgi:hypothetical protein